MRFLMKLRKYIVLILIFFLTVSKAQINRFGIPAVVNYPPEMTRGAEQNWAIVQDNRGVIYIGNDEQGVLEYDGGEWRTIAVKNNSIVRSLDCSQSGTVYVGAVSEIGYLAPDKTGKLEYVSLLPLLDSSDQSFLDVWKTYCVEEKVYFHSEDQIMIYNSSSNSIKVIEPEMHCLFAFYENDHLYVGNWPKGLLVLQGDSITVPAIGGDYYIGKNIFGLTSFDNEHLLIGCEEFGLSLYNINTGRVDHKFASEEANNYLNMNFLTHLGSMNNGNFAASTIGGGVAIIDRNGDLIEIVSKEQGLQDQTVYNSYLPGNNYPFSHLWTALSFGVGKISFNSPLRQFTEISGLIRAISSIGDKIFVGTSTGLYFLSVTDNFSGLSKIESLSRDIYDLEKFTLESGEEVLLAIGAEGLMQVDKHGNAINLRDRILGDIEEEKRVFWGFDILRDPKNPNKVYLGQTASIRALAYDHGTWRQVAHMDGLKDEIRSLAVSAAGNIWFANNTIGLGILTPSGDSLKFIAEFKEDLLPTLDKNTIFQLGNRILIGTQDGVYRIMENSDTFSIEKDEDFNRYLPEGINEILYIYEDPDSNLWLSFENSVSGWKLVLLDPVGDGTYSETSKIFYSLENFSTDIIYSYNGKNTWFSKSSTLYNYDNERAFNEGTFRALIRKVTFNEDSVVYNGAYPSPDQRGGYTVGDHQGTDLVPHLKYAFNNVEFRWSAPYYNMEDKIQYSYFLEGFSKNWSDWDVALYQDFTNLPHGDYTFRIKARNVYMDESQEDSFSFVILRPWYLRFYALLIYIFAIVLIVYVIIVLYTRRLKNENIRLEGIIQERTAEIRKQKEELTDSIEYASRIQRALLPPEQILDSQDLEYFILFRPRDIVSGDFYWFASNSDKVFIVAADCTGHGVPGAFMSMLGISFLDEIVIKSGISETNKILDALRNHVITSLRQTGKSMEESTKDGMDLSMVAIDLNTKQIQYSGAYNPLYVVRKLTEEEKANIRKEGELDLDRGSVYSDTHMLYQVKADHMPIGISEKVTDFSSSYIEEKDVTIYLFSDGYVDQFGGESGKKFMTKNFKKLLLDIQGMPMKKQKEELNNMLIGWMGDISQIDDVLVIGVKLK